MEYALKERIGNPTLFTGRKEELGVFLKWIDQIKDEKSQSTALLARRKMGKTALMERLFNITFAKNGSVIPFYYEIKETKMWVVDFCKDFFLTFIYQYIAFKSRKSEFLKNMPENEAVEMIYMYSHHFKVPVSEETVFLMSKLSEGSPFYISSIIRSSLRKKDLTTLEGLSDTLEFETMDDRGTIKFTWMEYVAAAFPQINDKNAKNIVLYLCKNRDRELTRAEILRDLKLDMTDAQLEKRLKALVKADIISQGKSNFRYRGVRDNIFDKVFRGVYEEEIHQFDLNTIKKEYIEEFAEQKKQYAALLGKYNYRKGLFAEYLLLEQLRLHALERNELLKSVTRYLPADFNFCGYSRVWRYNSSPVYGKGFNVDVFARAAAPGDYSIICEVKSRDTRKFSKEEAVDFERKFTEIKRLEKIEPAVGFIFSRSGFTKEADEYCRNHGFACSDDERWLGPPLKPGSDGP
ncbi:MAG: hypothetical protein GY757_05440 [bacterium]|nr:hypothetical protein [bacterium]